MAKTANPLLMVEECYHSLSKAEKRVADYVRLHPDRTIISSLQAVSEKCSVSDTSLLRFCRSLRFSGYQDFKGALVPELLKRGATIYQEVVYALKKSRDNGAFTIGMTNFSSSSVTKISDLLLLTSVPKSLLGSYSCQPRIAQLALLEFITFDISTLLKQRGDK